MNPHRCGRHGPRSGAWRAWAWTFVLCSIFAVRTAWATADLTIANTTYTSGQTQTIDASNTITTSGSVVVASGASITLRATTRISLEPGFAAQAGAAFHALITPITGLITPTITWSSPSSIPYGVTLSSTQLNASAGSVAGSFSYSPTVGALLTPGTYTLTATFTPTDTSTYETAVQTVTLTVVKATPDALFSGITVVGRGTVAGHSYVVTAGNLSAAFFNHDSGAATPPSGAVTYSIGATALHAGDTLLPGPYTVTASCAEDANYQTGTTTATFLVHDPNDSAGGGLTYAQREALGLDLFGSATGDDGETELKVNTPRN